MNNKLNYIKRIDGYTWYSITSEGEVINHKTGRILKQSNHSDGYKVLHLTESKKSDLVYVHRLVAAAFVQNPDNYNIVDHLDRNRSNNNLEAV